jgi:flavin-dependent dehydrogenase
VVTVHCDVLIAGGGPAGLAAAIALRQRGANVLVVDGQQPPIDKACGEGLMPDCRQALAQLGVDLEARHGAEFAGIQFADEAARVSARFPHGAGLGVRRTVLHQALLERAAAVGVRMVWKTPVVFEGPTVRVGDAHCRYRWLIGADGQASRVRRWADLEDARTRSRRFAFREHYQIAPWSSFVEIHWSAVGQAYVTPTGPDEICVSAITRQAGVRLEEIIASLPTLRDKLADAAATSRERGAVTLTRRLRRVTRGHVALIGDASGSVDSITGEGLALGFRQAILLAESLDAGGLELYKARHGTTLALPQRMAAAMLLLDRFPGLRRRAIPALAARPELFQRLLAVHVGEQTLEQFVLRHGAELGWLLLAQTQRAAHSV